MVDEILKERGARYGAYIDVSSVSQSLKEELTRFPLKRNSVHQESLDMIANKLARIICGDPDYVDSWQDIIGYSQLVINDIKDRCGDRVKEV